MTKISTDTETRMTMDDKMDAIVYYLQRLDRRDKWRTFGGFFKTILALLPAILFVYSAWYFYQHSTEIMTNITKQAAEQAAKYSQGEAEKFIEKLKGN